MNLREWADQMPDKKLLVDPATHVPTINELNNLCYLSFKYIAGWHMRQCDFAVVTMMGGTPTSVNDIDTQYGPALAEYIWDHILGEPDDFTVEDIEYAVKAVKNSLYAMGPEIRESVENVP
jgi:hypothetical protein